MNTHKMISLGKLAPTALLVILFAATGLIKIVPSAMAHEMAVALGVDTATLCILGITEIIATALFVYNGTWIVGFLLLVAFMGGAAAAHLLTGDSVVFPLAVQGMLWLAVVLRFPVFFQRVFGRAS